MPFSEATSTNPAASPAIRSAVAVAPLGQRVVAALGDRLGAPLHHLAALEVGAEERMALHPLQQHVHVERRLAVVEADHEAEGHEVRLQRIEEAAAEGVARQRPAQGVDDRVQRLLRLPELLHPERVDHAGSSEPTFCQRSQAWVSAPRVPSDSTVTLAVMSVGGV